MAAHTTRFSICAVVLTRMARCAGSSPTIVLWMPSLSAKTGISTQASFGRFGMEPSLMTLPLNRNGVRSPKRALKIFAAYSLLRLVSTGSCSIQSVISCFQLPARSSRLLSENACSPAFQLVLCVQYLSIRSGRLRNQALYSELWPLDSVT